MIPAVIICSEVEMNIKEKEREIEKWREKVKKKGGGGGGLERKKNRWQRGGEKRRGNRSEGNGVWERTKKWSRKKE